MDTVVESMKARFKNRQELFIDLHLLALKLKTDQYPKSILCIKSEKLYIAYYFFYSYCHVNRGPVTQLTLFKKD